MELFQITDVTADVLDLMPSVEANVALAQETMVQPECPDVAIGPHCKDCPLKEAEDGCWAHVHAEPCNVFSLYRLRTDRAFDWYNQGFLRSDDVPDDFPLSDRQKIQIETEQSGEPHVERDGIKQFIDRLEYPLFFLDYETFSSAIPLLDNSSPYQQVPFQFSLHVLRNSLDEVPQHISWIWDGDLQEDPRLEMLHLLKHLLEESRSVIAYNVGFEKMVMKKAVALYPEHEDWLKGLLPRFVDLLIPFRNFWAYHPAQHGSCSIKYVLPAWTGKTYEDMEIADGEAASREYMRVTFGDAGEEDKKAVLKNLEVYCCQDTHAMLDLLRVLASSI